MWEFLKCWKLAPGSGFCCGHHCTIKCFLTKLSLRKSQSSNENLVHFPTCKELKDTLSMLSLYLALLSMRVIWNNVVIRISGKMSRFLVFWRTLCITFSTIHIWCCQGRGKPADGTVRNAVIFYAQSKVSSSGDTWLLFVPSLEV